MGFRNGAYCTVWSVEPKSDTMTKCRISISKKNQHTGEYEQDFSGFVSFVGTAAAKKASLLKEKDRIKLGDTDVSTTYDKAKNVEYINYKAFSFETMDESQHQTNQPVYEANNTPGFMEIDGSETEELPF